MNILQEFDTITAIATPIGTGGVGVIRISGNDSFKIIEKIFSKQGLVAGKIYHGWISDNGKKIDEVIEYNCSVLLTPNGNITSEIEEITTNKEIRTYGDKFVYEDTDESSIKRVCPAKISDKLRKEIEFYSLSAFKMLNMRGTARIDFLYDKNNNKLYVNEVNCIPFCLAHNLWEARNISYKELLNIMMKDAIENEVQTQKMTLVMDNDIIKKMTNRTIKEMK